MSFIIQFAEKLQAVRLSLKDNTMINNPQNFQKLTGTLDFLLNPQLNPQLIRTVMQQTSDANKYRPVEIKYRAYTGTDDLVTSDASVDCTKSDQVRETIITEEPDLFVSAKFTLEENWLQQTLEDGVSKDDKITEGFLDAFRKCRESMSSQALAKLVTNLGTNPAVPAAAGAYTAVQMLDSAGAVDVNTFDTIKNHQEENFMGGPIGIIHQGGTGNPNKYFNRLAVGNVNTTAGVDIREVANQFGMVQFKDQSVTANLGTANRALIMYPGLTQLYWYTVYSGDFAVVSPNNSIKGVMPDPIYPILWDFKIRYDDNCDTGNGIMGAWVVTVFKYFDTFNTPSAAFGGSYSDLAGFNGTMGYDITNP